ncbi:hypothetical protein AQUCO_00200234v1 [Aquilegia coerulea]|uniref:SKP1 component dimerisation domain-containing protein n=1 Tax=Aquilegia coerulea TaxID=218851 RepID=A0A2G5F2A0_AQUCA|nr:hypothetical protein AQUCO_00200234v1 [Aquilegia coerulea]
MTKKSMGMDGSSLSSRKDKGKATMVEETQKAVNNNGNVNVEKLTLGSPATEAEELTDWNDKFIDVDQKTVFNIILAANYLNIKGLLDLSCEKAAKMISGKPVPEIRRILGIKNHGFTEEEEEENRKWSPWAYED